MNRLTTLLLLLLLLGLGAFYYYQANYRVPEELAAAKPQLIRDFRSEWTSEVFFEDLIRGTRAGFRRVPGGWEMREPFLYPADASAVEAIIAPFQYNNCVLVADLEKNPQTPLASYGLATPRVVIRLTHAGKEEKILLGEEDLSSEQLFVLSQGRVLRTSRNLHNATQRTLEELRSKQIFVQDYNQIREVELTRAGLPTLRLVLKGGVWNAESPWKGKADSPMVNLLLSEILRVEVRRFYDDQPKPDASYGLDPPDYRVKLRSDYAEEELKVGRQGDGILVAKKVGANFIWELSEDVIRALERNAEDFHDRGFFRYFRDELKELRLGTPSSEIVFVKKQNQWKLAAPREYPLDKDAFEDLLVEIERLAVDSFAEAGPSGLAAFGLEAPSRWVQILAEGRKPEKFWVGNENEKGYRYVRRDGDESIALVAKASLSFLENNPLDYVNRRALDLSELETSRIEMIRREGTNKVSKVWIRNVGNLWVALDENGNAKQEEDRRFAEQLDLILHWKAKRVVSEDIRPYGFENPTLEIRYFDNGSLTEGENAKAKQAIAIVKDAGGHCFLLGKNRLVYEIDAKSLENLISLF